MLSGSPPAGKPSCARGKELRTQGSPLRPGSHAPVEPSHAPVWQLGVTPLLDLEVPPRGPRSVRPCEYTTSHPCSPPGVVLTHLLQLQKQPTATEQGCPKARAPHAESTLSPAPVTPAWAWLAACDSGRAKPLLSEAMGRKKASVSPLLRREQALPCLSGG